MKNRFQFFTRNSDTLKGGHRAGHPLRHPLYRPTLSLTLSIWESSDRQSGRRSERQSAGDSALGTGPTILLTAAATCKQNGPPLACPLLPPLRRAHSAASQ